MATTTTNYGFDIPQSTDLVKDGATAIATLGQDIDTAMNTALGTKKAGMVLLNTTSFSGVTSASFPADTFTTTYDNYRIIVRLTSSSSTGYLQMRLRAAGTDNTTANHDSQAIGRQSGGVTSTFESANDTIWYVVAKGAGDLTALAMDLFSPKLSNFTLFASSAQGIGAANSSNFAAGGTFKASTSFDSATLISSTGTITGTYSIYGYNK